MTQIGHWSLIANLFSRVGEIDLIRNRLPRFSVITLLLTTFTFVFGDELDAVDAFNSAYSAYSEHATKFEYELALPHALVAYEIGQRIFDDDHANRPRLAYNYGSTLIEVGLSNEAQIPLSEALNRYERMYGEDSAELIPTLMALGEVSGSRGAPEEKIKHYRRATKLFETHGDTNSIEYSILLFKAGRDIVTKTGSEHAERFLLEAYAANSRSLGDGHFSTGTIAMWLGEFYYRNRSYGDAEKYLKTALLIIGEPFPRMTMGEFKISVLLSKLYQETDEGRNASKYSRISRRMQPIYEDEPPSILYRHMPHYPAEAFQDGIEGYVDLVLKIDRNGMVETVEVVNVEGHESFEAEAIDSATRSVYWPGASGGRRVAVEELAVRIIFSMD